MFAQSNAEDSDNCYEVLMVCLMNLVKWLVITTYLLYHFSVNKLLSLDSSSDRVANDTAVVDVCVSRTPINITSHQAN